MTGRKRFFFEKKNQKTFAILMAALPAMLSGCAVGPDFHAPKTAQITGYGDEKLKAHDTAQSFVTNLDIPGQWWSLFHSSQVNTLVQQALAANPSLQGAQAALRQARESVYAQEGAFFPDITRHLRADAKQDRDAERLLRRLYAHGLLHARHRPARRLLLP